MVDYRITKFTEADDKPSHDKGKKMKQRFSISMEEEAVKLLDKAVQKKRYFEKETS